jgi:hypothetical protein
MPKPPTISVNEDERMIPLWSIIAATVSFLLVEYYWWIVAPGQRHHPAPPLGLRIYFNFSWGILASLYFLMMSMRFWIIICCMMPGGIGAVIYFLLRQPQVSECAACGTHVQSDFHFCPQCNYQLTASCGTCFRSVRATDQFCTRCGHELAEDHTPARLRVLGE